VHTGCTFTCLLGCPYAYSLTASRDPSQTRQPESLPNSCLASPARKITIGARLACAHAARILPPLSRLVSALQLLAGSREVQHARRLYDPPPLPAHTTRRSTETLRHLCPQPNHLPHELLLSTAACLSPACRVPLPRLTRASRTNPPAPQPSQAPPSTPHHPDAAPGQADRRPTAARCADPAAHRRGMSHEPDLT
jgi:hypothetical protein